ncbi:excalibur calcium-binding domain-containing protein [Gordonia neofelifaecis]|uniref:Excalibur domain-containing protein n=1 Tax=Gordonia neofelifaecis NRRL B-59395 TaxID=644548 RepID=F1YNC9_9ACTN|nr:excalibur calcium-binding domain-containing protein [Gordonia neofelifaecis]EGD53840.1 excalibur domain-containing protein [Gordonia neofelifaecis NRRL B-59395]
MKNRTSLLGASMVLAASLAAVVPAADAVAAPVTKYANCKALNAQYRHGVARPGAVDHVSGRSKPVRNFTVNRAVYNRNAHLDRDRDGIACEKR